MMSAKFAIPGLFKERYFEKSFCYYYFYLLLNKKRSKIYDVIISVQDVINKIILRHSNKWLRSAYQLLTVVITA